MKLTNQQILESAVVLQDIAAEKFPAKLAWKIQTAKQTLQPFVDTATTQLDAVRLSYALKDDMGALVLAQDAAGNDIPNTIQFATNTLAQVNQEISELLLAEVDVLNVELSLSEFPDTFTISANAIQALTPLLSHS